MSNKLHTIGVCLLLVVFAAVLYITSKVIVPLFLLLLIYRLLVLLIVKYFRKDLHSLISGLNALYVAESTGNSISNIVIGFVTQGEISTERICQLFQEQILDFEDANGKLVYERLQYSWTHFMGYSCWKPDSKFLLSNHVRDYDHNGELLLPSNKCNSEDLQRIWPKLAEAPWKIDQSPWEVLLVQNYCQLENEEPHTLVIFRVDHVHCDFDSAIELLRILFKSPSDANAKTSQDDKILTIWERLKNYFKLPYETAKVFLRIVKGRKIGGRYGAENMCCSVSSNISQELIQSIQNLHNVDFSTVILSAAFGAVARALGSAGKEPPAMLDVGYVLPLLDHPERWATHMKIMIEDFLCKVETSQERLAYIQGVLRKDHTILASSMEYYMRVLALLPSRISRVIYQCGYKFGPSFIMSSIPALIRKEYVDGLEIVDVFTAVSSATALGMFITSWGVNGQQRFNFLLDQSIFGDEASAMKIATFFVEELETLQQFGGSPLTV